MAAGLAGLTQVYTPAVAEALNASGDRLRERLTAAGAARGLPFFASGRGSMIGLHFGRPPLRSVADVTGDPAVLGALRELLHLHCLEHGCSYGRRGFMALSLPLTERGPRPARSGGRDVPRRARRPGAAGGVGERDQQHAGQSRARSPKPRASSTTPSTAVPIAPPMNSANTKKEIAVPRASGAISVPRVCSTEWQIGKPAPISATPGTHQRPAGRRRRDQEAGAHHRRRRRAASSARRSARSSRPTNRVVITDASASTASTAPVQRVREAVLVVQQRAEVRVAAEEREPLDARRARTIASACRFAEDRAVLRRLPAARPARRRAPATAARISSAASAASTTKIARHEKRSVRMPPSAAPISSAAGGGGDQLRDLRLTARVRHQLAERHQREREERGRDAAGHEPDRSQHRQAPGQRRGGGHDAARTPTIATEITRIGPTRSASGPHASWQTPYGIR